jgi:hypothetical protein
MLAMVMRKGADKPSEQEVEETFMFMLSAITMSAISSQVEDICDSDNKASATSSSVGNG